MSKKVAHWNFRDVSLGLQRLRDFLLGRKHHLHVRFPPLIAPRTIPQPQIPRGPEYKYSKQYYYARNAMDSVKPPVVATMIGKSNPKPAKSGAAPTPGDAWWWDGHCYYECKAEPKSAAPKPPGPCEPCEPCKPEPTPCEPCAKPIPPPCHTSWESKP